jgi:ubiquinol-cytochrome c reductase iron-sulfur subunit
MNVQRVFSRSVLAKPNPLCVPNKAHGHGPFSVHPHVRSARFGPIISGVNTSSSTCLTMSPSRLFQVRTYASGPVTKNEDHGYTRPDISDYQIPPSENDNNKTFAYLMVGSTSAISAMMMKNVVADWIVNLSASADVLALSKIEVDMSAIPEGKNVVIKWRGKPLFVRHRTADEIAEARAVDLKELRDPQTDDQRTQRPEWLVMLGVCTHLGCVPIGEGSIFVN